ncbi:MAG: sulfotransferase [Chthoniobacterales bacterium]
MPSHSPTHDLVLTGIPRSGTSLLCNLLHRYGNCVVINEPEAVSETFDRGEAPRHVPGLYHELRAAVRCGLPVRNKFRERQVVQDTTLEHTIAAYHPVVESSDFILGTKDTLAYLTGLRTLRVAMPRARFVACVRDPLQTIASWKASFVHLREASLPEVFFREPSALALRDDERIALGKIEAITALPERRAQWWNFLAERILEELEHGLTVIRYHELIQDPAAVVEGILEGWPKGSLRVPLTLNRVTRARTPLEPADYEAIADLCTQTAQALGLPSEQPALA